MALARHTCFRTGWCSGKLPGTPRPNPDSDARAEREVATACAAGANSKPMQWDQELAPLLLLTGRLESGNDGAGRSFPAIDLRCCEGSDFNWQTKLTGLFLS